MVNNIIIHPVYTQRTYGFYQSSNLKKTISVKIFPKNNTRKETCGTNLNERFYLALSFKTTTLLKAFKQLQTCFVEMFYKLKLLGNSVSSGKLFCKNVPFGLTL